MNNIQLINCLLLSIGITFLTHGQQVVKPELTRNTLQAYNRTYEIRHEKDQENTIISMKGRPEAGLVWIKDLSFGEGTIEFNVRGKDSFQQSFVGMAFHGLNDSTYQAIYFRPFNFRSEDPIRKKHAVQYISLPKNDWPYLRESFPGQYEAAVPSDIDPNDWFHVKLIIGEEEIAIFVNAHPHSVLNVKSRRPPGEGKIGFWTGDRSDGDFSDLIVHKK